MLMAHGPIGYLIVEATKKWWKIPEFSKKQNRWIFMVGIIGGMFPDIDLVFYYFISASQSHRQLLTHSIVIYVAVFIIGLLLLMWSRFRYVGVVVAMFAITGISHICADMIVGMTALFSPFSTSLFGLISFEWFRDSIFLRFSLVTSIGLELLIMSLAGYVWVKQYRPAKLKMFFVLMLATLIIGISMIVYVNEHVYRANGYFYYLDQDNDGIVNAEDRDIDGDGILNVADVDIDADEEDNSLDFYRETYAMQNSLYDYTAGVAVEVPLRLGFVTASELVKRSYANVGIFFGVEMAEDYYKRNESYKYKPSDNEFSRAPENWQVWLAHQDKLLEGSAYRNEFDILFFASGHVGLLTRVGGVDNVLEAHVSHLLTTEIPLSEVEEREGGLVAIGRLLPKPIEKQY